MIALSGSSSRSAWFFLIVLTIIYQSAGKLSQVIVCSQPDSFTVQITEKNEHVVYGTELLIKYNPHVEIFSYPEIKPVNVVFDETVIEFKGNILLKYPVNQQYIPPEKLSWDASGIILGIGTLQKLSKEDYAVQNCRLFLPTNIKGSANLPRAVEEAIIYYVQSCAKEHLCERIGTLKAEQLQNITRYEEYGYNIARIIRPKSTQVDVISLTFSYMQLNMNVIVDFILKEAMNYIKQNGKSIIKIPDVTETHTVALGIKCHFETHHGTFEGLSTINRTEDAVLSNTGDTYVIKAGFGFSTAKFNYSNYKLQVGSMGVSGTLLGSIDRFAITAKLIFSYDKMCDVNVKYIRVTKVGKINLKMTGLGLLDSLTSKILTWLTNMWQYRIVQVIEVNVRKILEEQLSEFICKNYNEVIYRNIFLNSNH